MSEMMPADPVDEDVETAEVIRALEEAMADIANGNVAPAEIALSRVRKALGLPGRGR